MIDTTKTAETKNPVTKTGDTTAKVVTPAVAMPKAEVKPATVTK
jgi:hypothetical protein